MDILDALRSKDQLPLQLQRVEDAAAVMWRLSSVAADEIERLRAERDALKDERDIFSRTLSKRDAERDILKQDAERYRWIIKHMRLGIGQNGAYWSLTDATQVAPNHIGEVDATIDAALRGEE